MSVETHHLLLNHPQSIRTVYKWPYGVSIIYRTLAIVFMASLKQTWFCMQLSKNYHQRKERHVANLDLYERLFLNKLGSKQRFNEDKYQRYGFMAWIACFCCILLDVLHQLGYPCRLFSPLFWRAICDACVERSSSQVSMCPETVSVSSLCSWEDSYITCGRTIYWVLS